MSMKILEISKISPSSSSTLSPSSFSLSLTYLDWNFMNLHPMERLLFYPLTLSDPPFLDSIVPKLKQSLSVTLHHFLPVAGNLVWPEDSSKPFILYTPNDAVSFTVAETDSDFNHFSSSQVVQIQEYRSLVPTLQSSDTRVPMLVLQVTKFQNDGFCIGMAFHHVLFDGKSLSMFLKAWAYICKLNESESFSLLPELTPSFDRDSTILQNPSSFLPQNKSLKFSPSLRAPSNWFHGTFELTEADIEKLKKRVLDSMEKSSSKELHLSTFVVAYAYVLVCLIKAQQQEGSEDNKFVIVLTADARGLLKPPISSNYFGNCLSNTGVDAEEWEFKGEDALQKIAKKISDLVLKLRSSGHDLTVLKPWEVMKMKSSGIKTCLVAASPKYKLYEADFGWGKPKKIQIVSLITNSVSLTDARDGGGGVEVGLVLPLQQMNNFASLFSIEKINSVLPSCTQIFPQGF